MPCVSLPYDPAVGPLLQVLLTKPAVFQQLAQTASASGASPPPTHPPIFANNALIDTGASITSVTGQIASQLGLPLIGKRQLMTASGTLNANVYVADIAIPFSPLPPATPGTPVLAQNLFAHSFPSMVVMEFVCNSPHFNMLLGRDILCQGILSIGYDRRLTFSI